MAILRQRKQVQALQSDQSGITLQDDDDDASLEHAFSNQGYDISDHEYISHSTYPVDQAALPHGQGSGVHMFEGSHSIHHNPQYFISALPHESLLLWLESLSTTSFASSLTTHGTRLYISLRSNPISTVPRDLHFFVGFNRICSQANLTFSGETGGCSTFMLSTLVPPSQRPLHAPVSLSMIACFNGEDNLMDREIGLFSYGDLLQPLPQAGPSRPTGKRKLSTDVHALEDASTKRVKYAVPYNHAAQHQARYNVPSPPSSHQAESPELHIYKRPLDLSSSPTSQQHHVYMDASGQYFYNTDLQSTIDRMQVAPLARSHSAFDARYPTTPQYSSPTTQFGQPTASSKRRAVSSPGQQTANPSLLALPPSHPKPLTTPLHGPQLDATGGLPHARTVFVLEGDLDSMLLHWTEEEMAANRRLVVFERKQKNNTITASFKPVALKDHNAQSICVSCIWWENRGTWFITSVDTIALAESLCGYSFTVPVKNRIRRNMEGYKPTTISKDKTESEDFFKVIMGFANPKPRNIEKHIKVFPWTCLGGALKKIVTKYGRDTTAKGSITKKIQLQESVRRTSMPENSTNVANHDDDRYFDDLFMQHSLSSASAPSSYALPTQQTYNDFHNYHAGIAPYFEPSVPSLQPTLGSYDIYQGLLQPHAPLSQNQQQSMDQFYWQQPQHGDHPAYLLDATPRYPDWTMPGTSDPGLTATPSSLQHVTHGLCLTEPGSPLDTHSSLRYPTYTPDLQQLQAQYLDDQAINGGNRL